MTTKINAYRTLRYVLVQLSKVAAPFTPFISEAIYLNLKDASMPESVHLCDFPRADTSARDGDLERRMALVQTVVRLGRQLRTENDLKVRQPLSVIHVVSARAEIHEMLAGFEDLVTEELNIKAVAYGTDETAMADVSVKADYRKLGPRFGAKMKSAAAAIAGLPPAQAALLAAGQEVTVDVAGESVALNNDLVIVLRAPKAGMVVASEGDVIVGVETALTPELVMEGLAREFVSRVQNMRKAADFEVTQRISVVVDCDVEVREAIRSWLEYVKSETLCVSVVFGTVADEACDLNGHAVKIALAAESCEVK
jgi:isoleucyl-tRNA synthetase